MITTLSNYYYYLTYSEELIKQELFCNQVAQMMAKLWREEQSLRSVLHSVFYKAAPSVWCLLDFGPHNQLYEEDQTLFPHFLGGLFAFLVIIIYIFLFLFWYH